MFAPHQEIHNIEKIAYNLIADCLSLARSKQPKELNEPVEEESDELRVEVMCFLDKYQEELEWAELEDISDQTADAIMTFAVASDIYRLRHLIAELDRRIGYESFLRYMNTQPFYALNSNWQESGLLLPRVPCAKTVHDYEGELHERKTAEAWSDELNSCLQRYFYVTLDEIGDYTICNIYYDPFIGEPLDELTLACAPLIDGAIANILHYDIVTEVDEDSGHTFSFLDNFAVLNPDEVNRRVKRAYIFSCENHAHLLSMPEMLGTNALYELDEDDYNPLLSGLNKSQLPYKAQKSSLKLICAPTCWENNANFLNIYRPDGRFLGRQYKQTRFWMNEHPRIYENLKNIPKQILLLHMPRLGRVMFAICADYLNPNYRSLLAKTLKATFLLCPSFSTGSAAFEEALNAVSEFGCTVIWLNCCSARNGSAHTGAVSAPTVPVTQGRKYLNLKCDGECPDGCIFLATIPLNLAGETRFEDKAVDIWHKKIQEEKER